MKNLFDLTDKVAIVTGASKGIGERMARGLAEYGAKVLDIGQANIHDTLSLGIMFEIESGNCIYGPCSGQKLTPVEIYQEENIIYLK